MAANYGQIIGGIASAAPALISGISQINQSKDLLNQIQAQGVDKISPELQTAYDYAKGQLGKGFSAGEEANFKQALADKEKAAYQQAMVNSGGNQSQAIWAAINAKKFGALNDFYGANANLKRQNFGQFAGLAGQVAGQENVKQNLFYQKQIAAGQGLAAGRYNAYNAATSMGNFIKSWFSPTASSGVKTTTTETPAVQPQQPQQIQEYLGGGVNSPQWSTNLSGFNNYPSAPISEEPTYYINQD